MTRAAVSLAPGGPIFVDEANFQTQVVAAAKRMGWRAYHTHDARRSEPGWPDLVLANRNQNRVIFVELKTDVGRLTDDQAWWLGILTAAKLEVYVWRYRDWNRALSTLAQKPGGPT